MNLHTILDRIKIKLSDWLIITVIVLFLILSTLFFRGSSTIIPIAVLSQNGETLLTLDLSSQADNIIDLKEQYNIPAQIEIKGNSARFINVQCPDHLCEKVGFVSKQFQSAVCMPNKIAITILDKDEV